MGEGKGKWLVVHGNVKMCTFNKMLKMLDCLVDCQELTIKSAVLLLGQGQLPGVVGNWTPHQSDELLVFPMFVYQTSWYIVTSI